MRAIAQIFVAFSEKLNFTIEQPIFISSQAKQVQSQDYFVVMDQIDFSVFFSFFFEIYGRAFAVFHSPFLLPYWVLTIG